MKLIISVLSIIMLSISQHENVVGEYGNHFGQTLVIHEDSTFVCNWNFHLSESWTKGKWSIKNDTVYFKVIPVFDTLRFLGKKDTLILSINQEAELITEKNASISHYLSNYSQNSKEMDTILFYKNDKLYLINKKGKLITKKQSFMSREKYDPWFSRKEK